MQKATNRDYPLAPTFSKDDKEKRKEKRKQNKIERSSGLEYEPKVRRRHMKG
jgi:hypothetical protein